MKDAVAYFGIRQVFTGAAKRRAARARSANGRAIRGK
jgi:hypothetical protein